jgi:hypothetical protein
MRKATAKGPRLYLFPNTIRHQLIEGERVSYVEGILAVVEMLILSCRVVKLERFREKK